VSYRVVVSRPVKDLLEELHRKERTRCRELALLLLRLEKDPRPDGSRKLASEGSDSKRRYSREERMWDQAGFRIVYRLGDAQRLVEIGIVSKTSG
jgi:mRNA-degrading endonuclease RelE of RelBE toxin-antitoxin system